MCGNLAAIWKLQPFDDLIEMICPEIKFFMPRIDSWAELS